MKRTPKRAPAPAFLVITSYPRYTESIGTKEQLVSLYPDLEARFLDGNRYSKYGGGCYLLRKKGGLFKVRKFHEEYKKPATETASLEVPLEERNGYGAPTWRCRTPGIGGGSGGFNNGLTYRDLAKAACLIADALNSERYQFRRSKLTLVKPGQNTDSFLPALPEERRGMELTHFRG